MIKDENPITNFIKNTFSQRKINSDEKVLSLLYERNLNIVVKKIHLRSN